MFSSVRHFMADIYKLLNGRVITFGIVDSLLYFSVRPYAIVVTGFGRLFSRDKPNLRKLIIFLLRFFYRDTIVICLNSDDFRMLIWLGFTKVKKING
jgi:hypothetical protein